MTVYQRSSPCDVADADAVDAAFNAFVGRFGRLDALFNNAGITLPGKPIDEVDVNDWRSLIDINLTGSFICARKAFGLMRHQDPRGGRIINNGSVSAQMPNSSKKLRAGCKNAVVRKSAPSAARDVTGVCGSTQRVSKPACAKAIAVTMPAMPPPDTTTSTE